MNPIGPLTLCMAALLGAVAVPHLSGQTTGTVGGAVTEGAAGGRYFQPKEDVDPKVLDALLAVKPDPVVIEDDDTLHFSVFGVREFDTDARVDRDGSVSLPFLGAVQVKGLTVDAAERKIAATLMSSGVVRQPAVTLTITQQPSEVVTVIGEVVRPGSFPTYGGLTLDRVIAGCGGFLPDASPDVTITREGYSAPIVVPMGPRSDSSRYGAIALLPRDTVQVSKVGLFYVVGAVKLQGVYTLKPLTPTTVVEAISEAGGAGYEALLDQSQIVRTEGDHRVLLGVHAGRILKGKEKDVALLSDDILFIPTSATKAAIKGGATSLIVSLASTYLYTHP